MTDVKMEAMEPSEGMDVEIGAFMIAISTVLLLRMDEDIQTALKTRAYSISSTVKAEACFWREIFEEEETT